MFSTVFHERFLGTPCNVQIGTFDRKGVKKWLQMAPQSDPEAIQMDMGRPFETYGTPVVQFKKTQVKKMSPWPGENDSPPNCFKIRKWGSAISPKDGFPF